MAGPRNSKATGRDMVLSLAVLLVPVVLVVWFFTRTPDSPQIDQVDWRPVLAQARSQAGYPVLAPTLEPSGWKPVKARYADRGQTWVGDTVAAGNRWELGFLSADQTYIGLNQSDQPGRDAFIDAITRSARSDGSVSIDGHQWQRRVSDDDRTRALVSSQGRSVVVVVGDTDYRVLEEYVQMLRSS